MNVSFNFIHQTPFRGISNFMACNTYPNTTQIYTKTTPYIFTCYTTQLFGWFFIHFSCRAKGAKNPHFHLILPNLCDGKSFDFFFVLSFVNNKCCYHGNCLRLFFSRFVWFGLFRQRKLKCLSIFDEIAGEEEEKKIKEITKKKVVVTFTSEFFFVCGSIEIINAIILLADFGTMVSDMEEN